MKIRFNFKADIKDYILLSQFIYYNIKMMVQ